jgi:hypothetical protein
MANEVFIYVSPTGDDTFTGLLAEPNTDRSDGPVKTIEQAQRVARSYIRKVLEPQTIHVVMRDGTYYLDTPLVFSNDDFGQPEQFEWHTMTEGVHPVVYEAHDGESPVISGGRRIDGFRETTVNGVNAWVADVSGARNGSWIFTELWVNGERRFRPVLPKKGEYLIEKLLDASWEGTWSDTVGKGTKRFGYAAGDIDPDWKNFKDVEILILSLWRSLTAKLDHVDADDRIAYMDRDSKMRLSYDFQQTGAAYNVVNVFEALDSPGEWYLDKSDGLLYYIPKPGESIDSVEVVAPYLQRIMSITGGKLGRDKRTKQLNTRPILEFKNITFSHVEWQAPQDLATIGQSAPMVLGAIAIERAHYVAFTGCSVEHVGTYAFSLEDNCTDVTISKCRMIDMGAGGVNILHGCSRNAVTDCEIGDGGHLYPPAAGVVIGDAPSNTIVHNNIHDLYYTGISVGWNWGYEENNSGGNIVEWNHIHHLGKGKLSDMGGVYTLGMQTGTRIRYNLIHDVWSRTYGGWAIYPDEGSSHLLIESNICYDTKCAPFHQHFGRENIVRNNIFAFGKEAQIERGRAETHHSFIFENNIVAYAEGPLFKASGRGRPWSTDNVIFRNNCYFHTNGTPVEPDESNFDDWQKTGQDKGSIVADPKFKDIDARDFTLAPDSPVTGIGFIPIDLSNVGPRE